MANIYSRILVFSLISFFIVFFAGLFSNKSVSILGLVAGFGSAMEKPGLGTIYNNFLGVEKVVLWHGSVEDCVSVVTGSSDLILFRWHLVLRVVTCADQSESSIRHFLIYSHRTGTIILYRKNCVPETFL